MTTWSILGGMVVPSDVGNESMWSLLWYMGYIQTPSVEENVYHGYEEMSVTDFSLAQTNL